jgi:ABC-type uncharacterized transport system substrate-binding protein
LAGRGPRIAFVTADDPVHAGLVGRAWPGRAAYFLAAELVAKRLELLRELMPRAARVALLVNPAEARRTEFPLGPLRPART